MLSTSQIADQLANRRPGYSLSHPLYCDEGVYQTDLERIWYRDWIFAVSAAQLGKGGSYATLQIGAYPVVVVKGNDGVIRAFHNVCRHRGRSCAPSRPDRPPRSSAPITSGPSIWTASCFTPVRCRKASILLLMG